MWRSAWRRTAVGSLMSLAMTLHSCQARARSAHRDSVGAHVARMSQPHSCGSRPGSQGRRRCGLGGVAGPRSRVLHPPAADPGITEDERRTIAEMMAKGTYAVIILATKDLDGTFERLQAGDAEVVQEPTDQPYGIRDCALRDPAGNLIRVQELR